MADGDPAVARPHSAPLLRTKELIVDQRAGLSDKDQSAARDREGDQFHVDTPVISRTNGEMGAPRAKFNRRFGNPQAVRNAVYVTSGQGGRREAGGLADLAQRITPVLPSMASREARSRPSRAGCAH